MVPSLIEIAVTAVGGGDLRRRRGRQDELAAVARCRHHPVQLGVPLRGAVARGRRMLQDALPHRHRQRGGHRRRRGRAAVAAARRGERVGGAAAIAASAAAAPVRAVHARGRG